MRTNILYDEDDHQDKDDDNDDCHLMGVRGRGDFPLFVAAPPHHHLSPILASPQLPKKPIKTKTTDTVRAKQRDQAGHTNTFALVILIGGSQISFDFFPVKCHIFFVKSHKKASLLV